MRSSLAIGIAGAVLLAQTGCVEPAAVRMWAAMSRDATARFPVIVRDLTGACVRARLADVPIGTVADKREEALGQCAEIRDLEKPLLCAFRALTSYMGALNDLAAGDQPGFDKELQGLATNIQQAGGFGAAQVKAVNGLVSFLARAATSGYQRKQLAADVQKADQDIRTLTETLAEILEKRYGTLLDTEEASLRARYRRAIDGETSRAVLLLVEERWSSNLERISARRSAAASCATILRKIQAGHNALAESAGRFHARELVPVLNANAESIRGLTEDFQKAF